MSVVTVRNPVEGEVIVACRVLETDLVQPTTLTPEEVARATAYLADGVGNVVLSIDFEGSPVLFAVQSIDLDFS